MVGPPSPPRQFFCVVTFFCRKQQHLSACCVSIFFLSIVERNGRCGSKKEQGSGELKGEIYGKGRLQKFRDDRIPWKQSNLFFGGGSRRYFAYGNSRVRMETPWEDNQYYRDEQVVCSSYLPNRRQRNGLACACIALVARETLPSHALKSDGAESRADPCCVWSGPRFAARFSAGGRRSQNPAE